MPQRMLSPSAIQKTVLGLIAAGSAVYSILFFSVSSPPRLPPVTRDLATGPILETEAKQMTSSTVQNILLRYALEEDLKAVLPPGDHIFSPYNKFRASFAEAGEEFDVFAVHARFDHGEVASLLEREEGGERAEFVTILREPADVYESIFAYYELGRRLHRKRDLGQVIRALESRRLHPGARWFGMGLNQQSFDLGAAPVRQLWTRPAAAARATLDMVGDRFSLVMVAERMEESLVLLAHQLCWPLHRMVALRKNARREEAKVHLTCEQRQTLSAFQRADEILYRHFSKEFDRRVRDFGAGRMRRAVNELRRLNAHAHSACGASPAGGRDEGLGGDLKDSRLVVVYRVREELGLCRLMALSEKALVKEIRERQENRKEETIGAKL